MVHQDQVRVRRGDCACDFLKLAFADQRSRVRTVAALYELSGDLGSGGKRELPELSQRLFHVNGQRLWGFVLLGTIAGGVAGLLSNGRNISGTIGAGTKSEFHSHQKRALRPPQGGPLRGRNKTGL